VAITSVQTLTEQLQQLQLLDAAQLKDLAGLQQRTDGKTLCADLVRRGWLTAFQANQLLMGKAQDLLLGPYLVIDRLGEGGTGQVFKGRHQVMKRLVALKIIRRELLADPDVIKRFYREVEVTSKVDSPHVVKAYDAGPVGGNHLLAIEYVDGIDLAQLVAKSGPLPVADACEYVRQAALGLQHIHEHQLVHRDVKPSNLVLTRTPAGGLIKVLDLGLARLHQTADGGGLSVNGALTMGTPDYLSPEQALDFHGADIRADVYSLGCVLHFLLAGEPPFAKGTLAEKLMRHQQTPPPPIRALRPEVPAAVAAVLARMMAKRPEDRYQTPGEAARALAAAPRRRLRRLPLLIGAGGVLLLLAAVAVLAVVAARPGTPSVAALPAPPAATVASKPPATLASKLPAATASKLVQLQGRDGVRDAVIDPGQPDVNFGTHARDMRLLRVGAAATVYLMRFDLSRLKLPRTAVVSRATLSFFVWDPHNGSASRLGVFPLTTAWDETTATWRQPGPGRGWKTPQGFATGQDTGPLSASVVVQPEAPGAGDTADPPIEYQLDVTALVRDWVSGAKPNDGVALTILSDPATDKGFNTRFQVCSSRYSKKGYTPKLAIQLGP